MKQYILCALLAALCFCAAAQPAPVFNRAPLAGTEYAALPIGAVAPEGWLLDQLQRMRDGLTGHLDEVYANCVGDRNAWLGGDGDTWERGPYWVDGLLPLAYILKDPMLIAKAKKWADAIITLQHEDGNIGNTVDRPEELGIQRDRALDPWPRMVALKILKQYYEATGDERVLSTLKAYFRFQLSDLPKNRLDKYSNWGKWRVSDNLDTVYWLYNLTGESFLLELGELLYSQAIPFTEMFQDPDGLLPYHFYHCVNLGQGLKTPVIHWQYSLDPREKEAPKKALEHIRHTTGIPTGLWAGDEKVHFGDPTCGSELCTAVETMYSAEEMLRVTGDIFWADYLERVAFNALPTQTTDDFMGKQYFQQPNQIAVTRGSRNFVNDNDASMMVYGDMSGYACCTCNQHQGWPKFTRNLWYVSRDGGLAAFVYAPCRVNATVRGGIAVEIREETAYPFREDICFTVNFAGKKVKSAAFPLSLRIPAWCKGAEVRIAGQEPLKAEAGSIVRLDRVWKKGEQVILHLPMEITTAQWYDQAIAVERGPLLYALRMEENWTRKSFTPEEQKIYGEGYWEVTSPSPWNYCFSLKTLAEKDCFRFEELPLDGAYPWNLEHAPVRILARANRLLGWEEYRGNTGPVAYWRWGPAGVKETGAEETVVLIPYGCTTLRISEFPIRP